MAVTIKDVAEKAGVSQSTVSKAMNGTSAVSEATRKKIEKAASALGYQPSAIARSFATKATHRIMFLADFPFDAAFVQPHLFEIMRGVQHTLDKDGYDLIMKKTTAKEASTIVENAYGQHQADGFVLHMSVVTQKLATLLSKLLIPHIVIGKPGFTTRMCWIDTDNTLSGEIAAAHLIDKGYESFFFVGGRPDDMTCWRRLQGVRSMLREHGLDLPQTHVLKTNSTLADGSRAAKKILKMKPKPQAIICANNPLALGVMHTLQDRNVRIPEDMALITFDTYPFSVYTDPQMTVVDINMYEMGQEAGRLVIQKLKHPKRQIQTFTTTPSLVQRGTT